MKSLPDRPPYRVTVREVAQSAGVSPSTVSRVLNDHPYVRVSVRTRVLGAIEALGYNTDLVARGMRTGRTMVVGVVGNISNPILSAMLRAAENVLALQGYFVIIAESGLRATLDVDLMDRLLQRRVDGVIWSIVDETAPHVRQAIHNCPVPIVLVDRHIEGSHADSVSIDHFAGISQAMRSLIDLGHRRISILTGPLNQWPGRERTRAYIESFRRANIEHDSTLIRSSAQSISGGLEACTELLALRDRPTALIAGGNRVTIGALTALTRAGVSIPHEMSVVTASATDVVDIWTPRLANIAPPLEAMGQTLATCLLDRINRRLPHGPRHVVLAPAFDVAASIAAPLAEVGI